MDYIENILFTTYIFFRVKQKEQKNRRKLHAVDSLCLSRALLQNTKQNAVRKRYRLSLAGIKILNIYILTIQLKNGHDLFYFDLLLN